MNAFKIIDLTSENIANYGVCGYKDIKKHLELRKKIAWFNSYYPKGLRIKAVVSEVGGYQGMIEYIPGNYAHRPVEADGYLFIHCLYVGLKKEYKGKGYASLLIQACIDDAQNSGMKGVAVVTRKGSFMANDLIFLKMRFTVVDEAKPDFHLMVIKFDEDAENPKFKEGIQASLEKYGQGLTILRSPQCPYTEKNVNAIIETAQNQFHLPVQLIDLSDAKAAQNSPCPFGTFGIIFNGKIISHHPISNTRFVNIIEKLMP
ncbi:GNAT family N-acetyltransferase [Acetobacterium bakii]|uniref:Acetyltransferase n=1 Tax=Acetobacterium bakii TaxID=52689 RepID=A0A0L6U2K9_9FIRM|nr:GNAT family N-acetyltransferase [Acetobacterium bakii]KNZ42741.1 acetyltransferase [Acetobacterium bakii]